MIESIVKKNTMVSENLNNSLIFFLYKKKFLIIYTIIGFSSILCELFLREILINFNQNKILYNYVPLIIGIIFAFYFNIRFNFQVPKIYLKRSLIYFFLISISSFIFQKVVRDIYFFEYYDYNFSRLISSGIFFLLGYFLHKSFTFKKKILVGVAIYANGYENLDKIKKKVGEFPDFIHVDLVDNSMKKNSKKIDFSKLKKIKKVWPEKEIHTHIMSLYPSKIIEKVKKFSKIIYIHYEIKEDLNLIKKKIQKSHCKIGIILHSKKKYKNVNLITEDFNEIMILSIDRPGYSGQKFNRKTLNLIKKIDNTKNRRSINLLVDGGINQKIIKEINCDKIVSGSAVLNSKKPILEIMRLQTASRYEL